MKNSIAIKAHKSLITTFTLLCIAVMSLSVLSVVTSTSAHAVIEAVEFDSAEQRTRYQSLIAELRCLVCQNQNLADSDAELAQDLRSKTLEMLKEGKSDKEILAFMQARYGDFVLYRPPLNLRNAALWLGPFFLLLIVFVVMIRRIKRQSNHGENQPPAIDSVDATALAKAEQVLSKQDSRSAK